MANETAMVMHHFLRMVNRGIVATNKMPESPLRTHAVGMLLAMATIYMGGAVVEWLTDTSLINILPAWVTYPAFGFGIWLLWYLCRVFHNTIKIDFEREFTENNRMSWTRENAPEEYMLNTRQYVVCIKGLTAKSFFLYLVRAEHFKRWYEAGAKMNYLVRHPAFTTIGWVTAWSTQRHFMMAESPPGSQGLVTLRPGEYILFGWDYSVLPLPNGTRFGDGFLVRRVSLPEIHADGDPVTFKLDAKINQSLDVLHSILGEQQQGMSDPGFGSTHKQMEAFLSSTSKPEKPN